MIWWFNTRTSALHSHHGNHGHRANSNSSTMAAQHACASMLDEVVTLWRLAALDPAISPPEQDEIEAELRKWHLAVIEKVRKGRGSNYGAGGGGGGGNNVRKVDVEIFAGFKPGIEACLMNWQDFAIEGVTYSDQKKTTESIIGATPVRTPARASKVTTTPKAENIPSCSTSYPISEEPADSSTLSEGASCKVDINVIPEQADKNIPTGSVGNLLSERTAESSIEMLHRLSSLESISSGTDGVDLQRSEGTSRSEDTDSDDVPGGAAAKGDDADVGGASGGKSVDSKPGGKRKVKTKHLLERVDSDSADNEAGPSRPVVRPEADSDSSNDGAPPVVNVEAAAKANEPQAPSSDEYAVYFYDTKAKLPEHNQKKRSDVPNPFAGIKKMEDRIEVRLKYFIVSFTIFKSVPNCLYI